MTRWLLLFAFVALGSGCSRDFSLADAGGLPCQVMVAPVTDEPFDVPDGGRWVTGERGLRAVDTDGRTLLMTFGERLVRLSPQAGRWSSSTVGPEAECFEVRGVPGGFAALCDADGGTAGVFESPDGGWASVLVDPARSARDGSSRVLARRELFATGPRSVALSSGATRALSPSPTRMLGVTSGANDDDVFVGQVGEGNSLQVIVFPPAAAGRLSGAPGTLSPVSTFTIPALPDVLFGLFDASGAGFDVRPIHPQPEPPPPTSPPLLLEGFRAPVQSAVTSLPLSAGPGFAFVSVSSTGASRRLFLAFCDATCRSVRVVATSVTGMSELGLVRQGDELLVISESSARRLDVPTLVQSARQQCAVP